MRRRRDIDGSVGVMIPGPQGDPGEDGADGKNVLYGAGPPTTQGVDGEFYIDQLNHMLHGPKSAGTWPEGVSMIGAPGNDGAPGAPGTPGTAASPYRSISFPIGSKPVANEVLAIFSPVSGETVTIDDDLVGSTVIKGYGGANPTATFILKLWRNGVEAGTITISPSGSVTKLTAISTIVLRGGLDVLTVTAPATADATFINWTISLRATVQTVAPPAESTVADPHYASVKLLVGADTAIVDESPVGRTLTNAGAVRSIVDPKYGVGSVSFPVSTDGFYAAASGDWNLSGDFTIEAWIKPSDVTSNMTIAACYDVFGTRAWIFGLSSAGKLGFTPGNGSSVATTEAPHELVANAYQHVAVDRQGDIFRIYVGGIMLMKETRALTIPTGAGRQLDVGVTGGGFNRFLGQIDELRLTKGVARYASDAPFTPPVGKYARVAP